MKKKILVVDDEKSICLLLNNFLGEDYDVITITNGEDALAWLEANLPDLIISDIQMGSMDGFEFLKKVRQRGFTKHTPFIMLSARAESKERIRCYRMGAQDYLTKPFDEQKLINKIKEYTS